MTEDRQWYNVGAVKRPRIERDVAASVFTDHPERFSDVLGADTDDEDERFPVGSNTTYSAHLTEKEADRFASARNLRYIEPDGVTLNPFAISPLLPHPDSQRYVDAEVAVYPGLTGTEPRVAVIDEGTTTASRAEKNLTLIDRALFQAQGQPTNELWANARNHGCCTSGLAVPYGGKVLDAFAIENDGSMTDSALANAITWSITRGAQFINMSLTINGTPSVVSDAINAANSSDVAMFCAAGNDNLRNARFPASMNQTVTYVHSIMSIDMSTGQKSSFSNYGPWHTGTAPGELVYTTSFDGSNVEFGGTSASTPHVLQMAARIYSAGVSAKQAAAALKATVRDVGLGEKQGGGLYSMQAALRWLGKEPPIVITRVDRPQKPGLPIW